jgi:hypothetical protein
MDEFPRMRVSRIPADFVIGNRKAQIIQEDNLRAGVNDSGNRLAFEKIE